jgi:hypothetical protein
MTSLFLLKYVCWRNRKAYYIRKDNLEFFKILLICYAPHILIGASYKKILRRIKIPVTTRSIRTHSEKNCLKISGQMRCTSAEFFRCGYHCPFWTLSVVHIGITLYNNTKNIFPLVKKNDWL